MRGRWSRLSPLRRGLLSGIGGVLAISLGLLPGLAQLAELPSAELLRYMATIGAALLIAYAVQTAAVAKSQTIDRENRENWIGAIVGAGSCAFLGIIVTLALAERAEALAPAERVGELGRWIWLDELAFSFAVGSLFLLGAVVVALPYLTYEWAQAGERDSSQDSE